MWRATLCVEPSAGILNIGGVVVGDAICFEVAYDDVLYLRNCRPAQK